MTKKLEQLLNVTPIAELKSAIKETDELDNAINLHAGNIPIDERINTALPLINDIMNHDREMDEIAIKALNSYQELCDAADNTPAMYAGKLYEVGSTFLRTALDAKEAKLQKKLRVIELQLKKLRIDKVKDESGKEDTSNAKEFDRNALMSFMKEMNSGDKND
jgi:hypothetical protein